MIIMNQDIYTKCVFTLRELTTRDGHWYLFKLTNIQSNHEYFFTQVDTSNAKDRYNLFLIYSIYNTAGIIAEDILAGIVTLPIGMYKYQVYETSFPNTLNPFDIQNLKDTIVGEVENGIWHVNDSSLIPSDTQLDNPNMTDTIYY